MIYKRITSIDQDEFNDEMFDACRRFVTWDMPRIEKVAARYANQHTTTLNALEDGWFQIAPDKCPQNYGYNAIQLKVPAADMKVTLDFKGFAGGEGFASVRPENAGWRYGFLAHKKDGTRVYSDTFSQSEGTAEFTVPAGTEHLWLVVMGAPTEHWTHTSGRGGGRRGRRGARRGADNAAGAEGGAARGGNADGGAARGGEGATAGAQVAAGDGNAAAQQGTANAGGAPGRAGQGTGRGEQRDAFGPGGGGATAAIAQWPYRFKLTGTEPDDAVVQ
jgi:hypothetical protein